MNYKLNLGASRRLKRCRRRFFFHLLVTLFKSRGFAASETLPQALFSHFLDTLFKSKGFAASETLPQALFFHGKASKFMRKASKFTEKRRNSCERRRNYWKKRICYHRTWDQARYLLSPHVGPSKISAITARGTKYDIYSSF